MTSGTDMITFQKFPGSNPEDVTISDRVSIGYQPPELDKDQSLRDMKIDVDENGHTTIVVNRKIDTYDMEDYAIPLD